VDGERRGSPEVNTHPAVRMFTLVLAWPAASRMCSSGGSPRFTGDSPTRWNGGRLVGKPMKPGSHRTSNFQSARDRGERTPRRRGVSAAGDMRQIGDLEYGGTTPRGRQDTPIGTSPLHSNGEKPQEAPRAAPARVAPLPAPQTNPVRAFWLTV
jgi:hypothetical protein